jgi:hypothetical protein
LSSLFLSFPKVHSFFPLIFCSPQSKSVSSFWQNPDYMIFLLILFSPQATSLLFLHPIRWYSRVEKLNMPSLWSSIYLSL